MRKQHFILPILLLSLVGLNSADDAICNKSGVEGMKHIYHCCKHPDGHNEIAEKCSVSTSFKLPSSNEESLLDISPENAIKSSCFSECIFNESKFYNNGVIDINSIRQAIQSENANDPEYVKEMMEAFEHCHGAAEEKKADLMKKSFMRQHYKDRCDPMPGVILNCAIFKFFKNCPNSRWTDSQRCNDLKSYLKNCEKKFI